MGSARAPAPGGQADLFDRWLAHRAPAAPTPQAPVSEPAPAPPTPVRTPVAVTPTRAAGHRRAAVRLARGEGLLAWEVHEGRADLVAVDLVPLGLAAVLTDPGALGGEVLDPGRPAHGGGRSAQRHRGGETWRCDLASPGTPVEVVGRPGRRGWKVVLARRGRPPYVVDSSMVDPAHVTRVLAHDRPDVVDRP